MFGRLGVNMKLVVIIIYHGISLVYATCHIDHILTAIFCWSTQQKSLRLSWKHFARWRDLRKDLHMKTDKELESVLDICSVQFHLVLSIKRYMTSYIVIWRHFKWRQRWATFRFWAGSAPGLCRCSCCMWHVRIYIRSINTLAKNTFCLKRKNIFEELFCLEIVKKTTYVLDD